MIKGKGAQAKKVMDRVAWYNRKKPLEVGVVTTDACQWYCQRSFLFCEG